MTAIVVAMIVIVVIAVAVVVYVAYPHRGERLPVVPGLGDAVRRSVDALPTVPPEDIQDNAHPAPPSAPPSGRHART